MEQTAREYRDRAQVMVLSNKPQSAIMLETGAAITEKYVSALKKVTEI